MKLGYARVSTEEQNLDLQRQALEAVGCDEIFEDHGVSGAAVNRPALGGALAALQEGDVLIVWKLDRLGRSLPHLIEVITALRQAGIGFCSLQEQIDTTSAGGRFYLHILAALAEFERELISERTRAGMKAARRRGVHLGRPPKLAPHQVAHARELIAGGMSIARRHLTPFVRELVNKHEYNRLEMASALLILAYNMVRKGKPILEARRMFNVLARGAASLIEEGGSSRLH